LPEPVTLAARRLGAGAQPGVQPVSRWRAASIHLAISVAVGLGSLLLIVGVWYPPPYFAVSGAGTLVLLIIGVDLTLGPLLTLIVFDMRKRSLRFDLAVIALLQAAGLAYGLHIAFVSRPVFLVAERDQVTAVYANEVDMAGAERAPFKRLPLWGPELVSLQLPDDPQAMDEAIAAILRGGSGMRNRLAAYAPFDLIQAELLANSRRLADEGTAGGRPADQIRYVPVYCRNGVVYLLLDPETGEPRETTGTLPGS